MDLNHYTVKGCFTLLLFPADLPTRSRLICYTHHSWCFTANGCFLIFPNFFPRITTTNNFWVIPAQQSSIICHHLKQNLIMLLSLQQELLIIWVLSPSTNHYSHNNQSSPPHTIAYDFNWHSNHSWWLLFSARLSIALHRVS